MYIQIQAERDLAGFDIKEEALLNRIQDCHLLTGLSRQLANTSGKSEAKESANHSV